MVTYPNELEIVHALKEAICQHLCRQISEQELMSERQRLLRDYRAVAVAKNNPPKPSNP